MQCKLIGPGLVFLLILPGCVPRQLLSITSGQECNANKDCEPDKICVELMCEDPCFGMCGINSECVVQDTFSVCSCKSGHGGDPFTECKPEVPDCLTNNHCPEDQVCQQQMCVDPCQEAICGNNTLCSVKNHYPICTCKPGYSGDPLQKCVAFNSTETAKGNEIGKKIYLFSDNEKNWMDALSDCLSRGMHLATVNNEDEWNNLLEAWDSKYSMKPTFWLGAHDLWIDGRFVWLSTAKQLTFTNWRKDEPKLNLHCILVDSNKTWMAAGCNTLYHYACESVQ